MTIILLCTANFSNRSNGRQKNSSMSFPEILHHKNLGFFHWKFLYSIFGRILLCYVMLCISRAKRQLRFSKIRFAWYLLLFVLFLFYRSPNSIAGSATPYSSRKVIPFFGISLASALDPGYFLSNISLVDLFYQKPFLSRLN